MGWFGWTAEQTLATDMEMIVLAYEGRKDMFTYIFGAPEPVEETTPEPPISQDSILSIFRAMNAHPERKN